ncbi:DUF4150 domain-containing protein [Psychrobacter celer]|uniref:DUF4150 domain-containing protein n=1 Tax=Psychrobacter celer TaxID=306572 RepID=UPI003FD2FE88
MSKTPRAGSKATVLMAISNGPSFNYTSHKKDAVAGYTLYAFIDNAEATAEHTFFNGQPAYLLDQTTQPKCFGDAAGIGGGVRSGTVGGEVKPTSGSSTIFIEGKALVREGDTCTMNNGNVTGKYVSVDASEAYAMMAKAQKAEEEVVLFAGPGMYGTDEIPGSSAAKERAERLSRRKEQEFLKAKNHTENLLLEGNHKYEIISPPVCSSLDPNCNLKSVVKVLNDQGAYPNQRAPNIVGKKNIGDVDIVGPWKEDPVMSSTVYDNRGTQIGIRNETLEGHALHPGTVERIVVLKGNNYHIQTQGGGYGYGGGPNVNEFILNQVWGPVDQVVIDEFKK